MKKNVFAAICVAVFLSAGSVFAAPEFKMSAGIGGLFTNDWTDYKSKITDVSQSYADGLGSAVLGGGVNLWFDATFAEVNIGLLFGNKFYPNAATSPIDEKKKLGEENSTDTMALRVGVLGKYPFALGKKITLFPLLGVDYEMALMSKNHDTGKGAIDTSGNDDPVNARTANGDDSTQFEQNSTLWFKAGVGADFVLSEKLYLRAEALYGIRLPTQNEIDTGDLDIVYPPFMGTKNCDVLELIGHGLDVKLGLGFKF
ncbi:MAG: outer membrane beta-barrel protein [Treponemataceae bacterium]|nr:MAG: outer membrane beta-barrel protein [Treponemataceae bacterium]